MKVNQIITTTQERELWVDGITLLSAEEFEMYKEHILPLNEIWWLRSPDDSRWFALVVHDGYRVDGYGVNRYCTVRPVLKIHLHGNLKIGDKFLLFGCSWTIISESYALCDSSIGKSIFRWDYRAEDANVYEASKIKQHLEAWMLEKMREEEIAG